MDPILLFLGRDVLPEEKSEAKKVQRKAPRFWMSEDKKLYKHSFFGPYQKLRKYKEKLLGFGCPRTKSCTNVLFLNHICFVYIPMHRDHFWMNCLKGFAEVTQEEDFYLIGPLLKNTSGQICKRRHKNMLRNVISVRDLRQTFTSLEEFSILFPALNLLLNGDWTL